MQKIRNNAQKNTGIEERIDYLERRLNELLDINEYEESEAKADMINGCCWIIKSKKDHDIEEMITEIQNELSMLREDCKDS